MDIRAYLERFLASWNPQHYDTLCAEGKSAAIWHIPLTVGIGLVFWTILLIPLLLSLSSTIEDSMGAFTKLDFDAQVEMNRIVEIPSSKPLFVIDYTTERVIDQEMVLLTEDYVYMNIIGGAQRIPREKISNPTSDSAAFSQIMAGLALFILPSVLFYSYVGFLLKYFFIVGISVGIVLFVTRILLLMQTSASLVVKVGIYAATPLIMLEMIIGPLADSVLVPLFRVLGAQIYLVSTLVYLVCFGLGIYLVSEAHHDSEEYTF